MTNGVPILGRDPGLVSISNSEQKTYKQCKRRWWLEYYRGLTPKKRRTQGPLVLGTRVHEALEQHYAFSRPLVAVYSELAKVDRLKLQAEEDFLTEEVLASFDEEAELGRIMMEGYLEWVEESGVDTEYEFVAMEKKISTLILGGKVELKGKVDAKVVRVRDGVRSFIDFKTAASFDTYDKTAHMDEQVRLYQLLEHLADEPNRTDGAIFRLIKKVKRSSRARPPFYRDLPVRLNLQDLRSYWTRIHGTVGDMLVTRSRLDAGEDHRLVAYPTPTRDCSWICPAYSVCPLFDDGSDAERALDALHEVHDPYARYDEIGDAKS